MYVSLVAAAVVLGLLAVFLPSREDRGVQPLGDSAASSDDGPNEAEVMLPMPGLGGELEPGGAPQREEVDERVAGIADPLWIQVNDTQGKPAPMRTIAITSTGELPIWLVEEYHETDADGRAVYDRSELRRIAESNDWQEVIIGVWDWRTRGFSVEQAVELSELRQISFVVPSESAILVQLVDLPSTLGPRIDSVDGFASAMNGVLGDGGWWRFQDVPLGHAWEISIVRGKLNTELGMISRPTSTKLPTQLISGPAVPGEIIRSAYRLSDHPCILGRLVDEQGQELKSFDRAAAGLRVAAFGAHSNHDDEILRVEALEGGKFALVSHRQVTDLSLLSSLHFDWQPSRVSRQTQSEILSPSMQVVRSGTAEIPPMSPSIQLGDVVLRAQASLLDVIVENESGEPVQGARVSVDIQTTWDTSKPQAWMFEESIDLLPVLETQADGRVRFTASSWDEVVRFSSRGQARLDNGGPFELFVNVEADGYCDSSKVITPGTPLMRVRLAAAVDLVGAVVSSSTESMELTVAAVPAGSDSLSVDPLSLDYLYVQETGATFQLEKVPVGTVDLVIYWSHATPRSGGFAWPIARIRGIELGLEEEGLSKTLPTIPLDPLIHWVQVDLGDAAREQGLRSMFIDLEHPARPDDPLTCGVEVALGIARVPLPEGVSTWTGSIHAEGFARTDVQRLSAGRHQVNLVSKPTIEIEFRLANQPRCKDWILLVGRGFGSSNFEDERFFRSGSDAMTTWVEGPGTLRCAWFSMENATGFESIDNEFEVTEADIERGYVVITPPDGF